VSNGGKAAPGAIVFFGGKTNVVVRALLDEGGCLSSPVVGANVAYLF
jgi:hypothetical protein